MSVFAGLKQFDAYSKPVEDFRERTVTGAIITICCSIVCLILFVNEIRYHMEVEVISELQVDNSRGTKMFINIDLTMSHLPCNYFSVDAMDVSGEYADAEHQLYKTRLDEQGNEVHTAKLEALNAAKTNTSEEVKHVAEVECGSCYGAETEERKCCQTCEEVLDAYRHQGWGIRDPRSFEQCKREGVDEHEDFEATKGEHCRINGHVEVNRVSGSLHISPGKTIKIGGVIAHDVKGLKNKMHNMNHTIKHLSFGDEFPGQKNPLDDTKHQNDKLNTAWHYYLKVVPTEFRALDAEPIKTNQYSVTRHDKQISQFADRLPGVIISYEIAPIAVIKSETRRSWVHFATSVCAIIGGLFTVSSIVDAAIYRTNKMLIKQELGKVG